MNKWYCCKCGHEFKNDGSFPEKCPKNCGNEGDGAGFMAMPADSRVHGHTYAAYQQNTAWARSANRVMADEARSNFQRQQSR
jgi:hypothetical protein